MKWAHLPEPGGLYDQHPDLLDQWRYLFAKRAEYEAEKDRQRQIEADTARRRGSSGKGRVGRRR